MFTITLTCQQLYDLYYEGPEATIHLIEGLLEELANQKRLRGERQQRVIHSQHERNERHAAQLKRAAFASAAGRARLAERGDLPEAHLLVLGIALRQIEQRDAEVKRIEEVARPDA